ncbi:glycoside hydrolase family 3 N-terminal domain-containing protein [Acaricomes phytoseiuli]|uniref:glycoside hydrolase family 3 N-terminal domain-containing protein n=1 Tax=Acaricomes phytoseiuli TaxID=291968 RepID=UPI0003A0A68A|nr:glycoside hydrolase family 3 N-terminal domain-containing protein [Acaricomes phytoseiuli]
MRRWNSQWNNIQIIAVLAGLLVLLVGASWLVFSGVLSGNQEASDTGQPNVSESDATESAEPSASPTPSQTSAAQQALAGLTPQQKVGQVVMASVPVTGPEPAALAALQQLQLGNVFLKGRAYGGTTEVSAVSARASEAVTIPGSGGIRPFVATDQEGGAVQIMNGPGFSEIPAAIQQGGVSSEQLRAQAAGWGGELALVGVNVNFAPTLDTVPSAAFAPRNAPIGAFGRQYGYRPEVVSAAGGAVAKGFADAGVAPTIKHFPGLGRVTGNTDTVSGVVDSQTQADDPYLLPFRNAIAAGTRWVMMSNASYPQLDAQNIAPFSPAIMGQLLRQDLGFDGIVVSDDMCDAVQLSPYAPATRAADFIAAGGTMALCTNPAVLPAFYQGVLDRAAADPVFAKTLDEAVLKVLESKAQSGLL